jgi:hypothetical protein
MEKISINGKTAKKHITEALKTVLLDRWPHERGRSEGVESL